MPSKVGIFGLSTMGKNLALNFSDNDVSVSVFNRTSSVTKEFVKSENRKNLVGFELVEDFINSLDKPRIVLLLVKSDAVDSVLGLLKNSLEFDDIVVDLGNSYFRESKLRAKLFEGNFIFCDCGISGGEKGARHGASFMIGGSGEASEKLKEVFAKVSASKGDYRCVEIFRGPGAGHFVKMTHNAIEYAVMQMYAELYALFIRLRYSTEQVIEVFEKLRQKGLDSYLLSITIDILKYDLKNNILRRIVEEAGQKGTGRWTSQTALDWGIGVPTLSAAVEARNLSSYFSQFSQRLSTVMTSGCNQSLDIDMLVDSIKLVYLTTYEQGVQLFKRSLVEEGFDFEINKPFKVWQAGCILAAGHLDYFAELIENELQSLFFSEKLIRNFLGNFYKAFESLKQLLLIFIQNDVFCPVFSSVYNYLGGLNATRPFGFNLIQAQRDYFGRHGIRLIDAPEKGLLNIEWKQ